MNQQPRMGNLEPQCIIPKQYNWAVTEELAACAKLGFKLLEQATDCYLLSPFFFFFFKLWKILKILWPHPQHIEVPGPGVESKP